MPPEEYFPSLSEVINFTIPHWEDKLLRKVRISLTGISLVLKHFSQLKENLDGNVFCYLSPAGLVALRLSNPRHCLSFDRVPRVSLDKQGTKGITSQSSGLSLGFFFKLNRNICFQLSSSGP